MLCCVSAAVADSGQVPGVCIHVYNYAGVPAWEMTRAQVEAEEVLARAGIETRWAEFLVDREGGVRQANGKDECGLGDEQGPTDLILGVVPRAMAQTFRLSAADLGFALLPAEKGEFGNRANVFFERVSLLGESSGASRALILGHAMAHEIGHLLLGAGSHSRSGIMRAPWGRNEFRRAATGSLHFTTGEASRMRRQVRARIRFEKAQAQAQAMLDR